MDQLTVFVLFQEQASGNESVVTGNTATTLTVASWGVATPDTTSKYEILDSHGIVTTGGTNSFTDSAKNYTTNILVGKRCRIIAGTAMGNEATITANTATTITAAVGTTDTTSVYVVYEPTTTGAGQGLIYPYNLTDSARKGRILVAPVVLLPLRLTFTIFPQTHGRLPNIFNHKL
jgi:hypothetical protein